MPKIEVVVGGNAGSESKGAIAAYLAQGRTDYTVVRVAGPNAGHSAYGVLDDKKYALCQIPVAGVTNLDCHLVIAAGSEIDPSVLNAEVESLDAAGYKVSERLMIDASATFMLKEYAEKEQQNQMWERLGSTAHGIGEARAARIMRTALTWGDALAHPQYADLAERYQECTAERTDRWLTKQLLAGHDVMIEGTQGAALSLHGPYYPKCTSSDCRAIDFLAMAGLSPWGIPEATVEPWVIIRTYPIRVAGDSGDLGTELSWEELGRRTDGYIQAEITTVTKRIRRVFDWNPELVRYAIEQNGGPYVCKLALGFFDYWYPELAGCTSLEDLRPEHLSRIDQVTQQVGVRPAVLGTGPKTQIDLRHTT